jgi:hypothetical protein
MAGSSSADIRMHGQGLKYALARRAKAAESLNFSSLHLGQMNPQHCPHPEGGVSEPPSSAILGQPLNIGQVATLLGCSAWTVRQRYLPQGLPYLRASANGRLVFFRDQVTEWVIRRQQLQNRGRTVPRQPQKGGIPI